MQEFIIEFGALSQAGLSSTLASSLKSSTQTRSEAQARCHSEGVCATVVTGFGGLQALAHQQLAS